jgi:DNA-binding SARP family transcriptional activator
LAEELRLTLLGGIGMSAGDTPVTGFISAKAQALVCYLALTGRTHARQAVAALFWQDLPEAAAATNLRVVLANLKRLLGDALLVTRQTLAVNPASRLWVDAVDFGELTAPTHADPLLLQRADSLYQGDLLDGFVVRNAPAFDEWVLGQRELLRQRALRMLRLLAAHHAEQADQDAAAAYLQRLLGIEPWLEEAHRALMAALAASGRHAAALRQYETCRHLLAEELGVTPAPQTTRLYEDIRRVAGREPQQTRKTSIAATWRGSAQPVERPSTLQYSAMR